MEAQIEESRISVKQRGQIESEDAKEGVQSFIERRDGKFIGKLKGYDFAGHEPIFRI